MVEAGEGMRSGDPSASIVGTADASRADAAAPSPALPTATKILLRVLRILCGVPIVSLLALGILFLLFSVTLTGRAVGMSASLLACVLYLSVGYWNRPWFKARRRRIYLWLLPIGLVLYVVPLSIAPSGRGAEDGRLRNCFLRNEATFPWFSPWNVIPEVDQFAVGTTFVPLSDPFVDFADTRRMRALEIPIYDAMEKDPGYRELGSVMGMAYRELIRLDFRTGHYFLFLPETSQRERLPCVIYLHGIGGNRKSHFWAMTAISARTKCAVIAPTFGFGNWEKPGGAELVVDVAREAVATLPIDSDRIYLAGYSNGAVGVTRAAILEPELFRGLIYISPVTEDELFDSPEFRSHSEGRRILFLHGGRDKRIARSMVTATAASLKRDGCDVHTRIYDDEDHSLILSQRESIADEIAEFID